MRSCGKLKVTSASLVLLVGVVGNSIEYRLEERGGRNGLLWVPWLLPKLLVVSMESKVEDRLCQAED